MDRANIEEVECRHELKQEAIERRYGLRIRSMACVDTHFDTALLRIEAEGGTYLLKTFPPDRPHPAREGQITEFLHACGIPVAPLVRAMDGTHVTRTPTLQYHIQPFIEGTTPAVNTAPAWLLDASARLLGRIQQAMQNGPHLDTAFDAAFFSPSMDRDARRQCESRLATACDTGNKPLQRELEERLRHINRVSVFPFDPGRLTYVNSHGDYYLGQLLVNGQHITVIDWSSAARVPACYEVLMSYAYADPRCMDGGIPLDGFRRYCDAYLAHAPVALGGEDLCRMPFFLYRYLCHCSFSPPFDEVPDSYQAICTLSNHLMQWLHEHVEDLSEALRRG